MGKEFKLDDTTFNGLLSTYKTNASSINHEALDLQTPDSKDVMIESYTGVMASILNTMASFQTMVSTNVTGVETVVSELKEMDEDLQNNI
ncbi:hypothetical protein [Pseudobutyrivibrio xylanivorans]|uniref:Uncharacterized protein n=1 Tax=Pseudobutyrivibrio xylanivorans TaxID=185007 RepID=A0A5P6VSI0_PSEXY|nr:hypothetical protein [Pseudobutyrivibrio xylanivorans]QFJ54669.1 hypothetical protein FXF36_07270 [Pseudobutyrivibrio xylanivorans]